MLSARTISALSSPKRLEVVQHVRAGVVPAQPAENRQQRVARGLVRLQVEVNAAPKRPPERRATRIASSRV